MSLAFLMCCSTFMATMSNFFMILSAFLPLALAQEVCEYFQKVLATMDMKNQLVVRPESLMSLDLHHTKED